MLLSDFVAVALKEKDNEFRRALRPAILKVDDAFLTAMVKLRNKSEKAIKEFGAAVQILAGDKSLYLGNEIQGGKKQVSWPQTLNIAASYLGTFHTHPYRERYGNTEVGIGFSKEDVAFYGQPHVRPNARNLAIHLVFSNDFLYLIIFLTDTYDTTDHAASLEGDDIAACRNYVYSVNRKVSNKDLKGEQVNKKAKICGYKNQELFYAMQNYIDDYDGDGNAALAVRLENELISLNYPEYPLIHMKNNITMNSESARKYNYLFYMGRCGGNPRHANLEMRS